MRYFLIRKLAILMYLLFFSIACIHDNDCPDCFTPPESLAMRIIDKSTNQDLIYNGTYIQDSIRITYQMPNGEQLVEFQIYTDSVIQESQLVSYQIGWESASGFKEFLLYLDASTVDTIYLNVEEMHTECCTYFEWLNFEINGEEPSFDEENYYYIFKK